MQPAGPEAARELLERTLEKTDFEPMQQRIEEQVQAGAFAFLHSRHADEILRLVEGEHPQTIAIVAAQLPPQLTAQVLAGFEPQSQSDILGRLARIGPTDAEVLSDIAASLQSRVGKVPVRTDGVMRAASVLRETDRSTSQSMLKSLNQTSTQVAGSIRDSLFSSEDLESLNDAPLYSCANRKPIVFNGPWR